MNSLSRSAACSFTKNVKPPSEDKWHVRAVNVSFYKKKKKRNPNTSYLHISQVKIGQYG